VFKYVISGSVRDSDKGRGKLWVDGRRGFKPMEFKIEPYAESTCDQKIRLRR